MVREWFSRVARRPSLPGVAPECDVRRMAATLDSDISGPSHTDEQILREIVQGCHAAGSTSSRSFVAYHVRPELSASIVPAPATRSWIKATREAFAKRCLPLLMANQSGWFVLNPVRVRA